jgi:membrane-associated phospholipid phosphatase
MVDVMPITRDPEQLIVCPPRRRMSRLIRSPIALTTAVVVAYVGLTFATRLQLNRPIVMVFCVALSFALSARSGVEHRALRLIRDWLPIAAIFVAYDFARGAARFGIHTSYTLGPHIDRILTGGHLPSVWLQRHFYAHGIKHWWDVGPTLLYFSHLVVPFLTLSVLWARSPERFRIYARRLILVTAVGLVLYVLHPTAPPWLDSRRGLIPHIQRVSAEGWTVMHLKIVTQAFYGGTKTQNLVAAFPSLHAAVSLLPMMTFWRRSRWWTRIVLVGYPLAMGFCLILLGEHWLNDVLAGWIVTVAVCLGSPPIERYVASHWPLRRRGHQAASTTIETITVPRPEPAMARVS